MNLDQLYIGMIFRPDGRTVRSQKCKEFVRQYWQFLNGDKCPLCQCKMNFANGRFGMSDGFATVDYIIYKSFKLAPTMSNMWFICNSCNHFKSLMENIDPPKSRRKLSNDYIYYLRKELYPDMVKNDIKSFQEMLNSYHIHIIRSFVMQSHRNHTQSLTIPQGQQS